MTNTVSVSSEDLGFGLSSDWRNYYVINEGTDGTDRTYRVLVTEGYYPGGTEVYNQQIVFPDFGWPVSPGMQVMSPNANAAGIDVAAADVLDLA